MQDRFIEICSTYEDSRQNSVESPAQCYLDNEPIYVNLNEIERKKWEKEFLTNLHKNPGIAIHKSHSPLSPRMSEFAFSYENRNIRETDCWSSSIIQNEVYSKQQFAHPLKTGSSDVFILYSINCINEIVGEKIV